MAYCRRTALASGTFCSATTIAPMMRSTCSIRLRLSADSACRANSASTSLTLAEPGLRSSSARGAATSGGSATLGPDGRRARSAPDAEPPATAGARWAAGAGGAAPGAGAGWAAGAGGSSSGAMDRDNSSDPPAAGGGGVSPGSAVAGGGGGGSCVTSGTPLSGTDRMSFHDSPRRMPSVPSDSAAGARGAWGDGIASPGCSLPAGGGGRGGGGGGSAGASVT